MLDHFSASFRFCLATTFEARNRAYALRHSVFRRELDYQMSEDPLQQLESDEYDEKSLIVLLEHPASGLAAGSMRLVYPCESAAQPLRQLPLEAHCLSSLTHPSLHPGKLPRERICEISRLAVPHYFRRRSPRESGPVSEPPPTDYAFSETDRATFPLIGVGLFLAATALVGLSGHHHVFAMMQERLPRLLAIYGLRFTCVGEPIVFHGKRRAFYIDQRQAVVDMQPGLRDLYRHIETELAGQYRSPAVPSGHYDNA
ncbi:PEP-CTERM/exosortase system-associated acyltransferase [Halomonas sp. HP20-15]|uniref:PEP-CTERM/exosortase system-associated acyltransferase n=1 Tax=Halomonas sp. HP20-15 TaxID=3085901 RepID=UPI00298161C9|nr:PEP-CTERM/exosortase system-associated acyltransferase [Halomonas sp. HP20-15]MDW5377663.1 PEP-CTERM/exosortase system-associated acyltransferase [Halomonas sp. HP20-15]